MFPPLNLLNLYCITSYILSW